MYKYSLFILIILSVSCRNRSTETSKFSQGQIDSLCLDSTKLIQIDEQAATVIDLNPFLKKKSFDFGENVKEVHFVPLETRDESLVANIYKIVVTDSMIYIMDNYKRGGVVIFDREGKFIDLDSPQSVSFYDIFSRIDLVPLETSEESILNFSTGAPEKMMLSENRFYFLEKEGVLIFDAEGRFMNKIHKLGKGPGEYLLLSDCNVNRYTGDVELLSAMGYVNVYDTLTPELLDQENLEKYENIKEDDNKIYIQTGTLIE